MDSPSRISIRPCQEANHERWRRCGRRGRRHHSRERGGAELSRSQPQKTPRRSGRMRFISVLGNANVDRARSAVFSGAPCDRSPITAVSRNSRLASGSRDRCASGIGSAPQVVTSSSSPDRGAGFFSPGPDEVAAPGPRAGVAGSSSPGCPRCGRGGGAEPGAPRLAPRPRGSAPAPRTPGSRSAPWTLARSVSLSSCQKSVAPSPGHRQVADLVHHQPRGCGGTRSRHRTVSAC